MKYTLDEVTEKLERACRRIDELQEKNLRLAEKNNSLIKDSIKAQEILTNESAAYDEREDLKRRLQNAELLIERMKDELSLAKGKEECLYQNFPETGCSLCCEDCWEMELERNASAPEGRVKHIDGLSEDGPR